MHRLSLLLTLAACAGSPPATPAPHVGERAGPRPADRVQRLPRKPRAPVRHRPAPGWHRPGRRRGLAGGARRPAPRRGAGCDPGGRAGDLIGASPLASALTHDEPSIALMDVLGLDVSSVGNHEFDEGLDELLRLQRGGCRTDAPCKAPFPGAHFSYLAANVTDRTGRDHSPRHAAQEGGWRDGGVRRGRAARDAVARHPERGGGADLRRRGRGGECCRAQSCGRPGRTPSWCSSTRGERRRRARRRASAVASAGPLVDIAQRFRGRGRHRQRPHPPDLRLPGPRRRARHERRGLRAVRHPDRARVGPGAAPGPLAPGHPGPGDARHCSRPARPRPSSTGRWRRRPRSPDVMWAGSPPR